MDVFEIVRLSTYMALLKNSPHSSSAEFFVFLKISVSLLVLIYMELRADSIAVLFIRSETPFCCSVYEVVI